MSSLYQDGYPSPSNHWWQATTLQHSVCFGGLPGRTVDVADNVKWQLWTTALWMCSASGCREQVRHTFLPDAGPCGWPREFCMSLAGQPTVVTGTTAPWCKEKEGHNLGKGVHVKNGPFPFAPIVLAEQHPSIHKTGQHTRRVDLTSHLTGKILRADKIQPERSLSGLMGNSNWPTFSVSVFNRTSREI